MELDPDLRLDTRLILGRGGWRVAASIAACAAAWALLWLIVTWLPQRYPEALRVTTFMPAVFTFHGVLLYLGLVLLVVAPIRAVWRLVDQEDNGLLDSARLCARPPVRFVAARIAGSSWFLAANGAIALSIHAVLQHGGLRVAAAAAIAYAGATAVVLLIYAGFPAGLARKPDNVKGTVAFVALFAQPLIILAADWLQRPAVDRLSLAAATAVVPVLAAGSVAFAARRIVRQASAVPARFRRRGFLRRLVPPDAPAELRRQFLYAMNAEFVMLLAIAFATALAIGARVDPHWRAPTPRKDASDFLFNFLLPLTPSVMPFLAMVIIASSLQRDRRAGSLDLARITPQTPLQIAAGRYFGAALPFWIGALVIVALASVAPRTALVAGWLPAAAVALPALALLEMGTSNAVPSWGSTAVMAAVILPIAQHVAAAAPADDVGAYIRAHLPATMGRLAIRPSAFDEMSLLPFLAAAVFVAIAAGRVKRPLGPSLAGPAAAFGVIVAALAITLCPPMVFPRVLAGLFAVGASLVAEERESPTAPWPRLAWAGAAAAAAGLVLARSPALGDAAALSTGVAAALALATGLLIHEMAHERPSLSFGLRLAIFLGLEPVVRTMIAGRGLGDERAAASAPQPLELAALAAAFAVSLLLHARRRAR